jgi:hypothetical protein
MATFESTLTDIIWSEQQLGHSKTFIIHDEDLIRISHALSLLSDATLTVR